MPHTRPLALLALTLLVMTACSPATDTAAPPASPSLDTSTGPAHPTPSASPSAADGEDVTACADGNCQLSVQRPVTIRLEAPDGSPTTLSVTEVGPSRIEYEVRSANGRSKGGASGRGQGCLTVLRENGSGNSCGPLNATRPDAVRGAVVIQATTSESGVATLHVVSP
ncbi:MULTISPECIES: hypothetical protein [Streptomyces]|uniref:hypothetical protein n=1 Tax=Streptomyces TaxID=1883 RepID=UPI0024AFA5D0|nr:hypothetical protein [Streptomyces sp. BPPL-273]WHM31050.1 hypothetical protein OH540_13740 [Streptomyces sp. BPPL-273]